MPDSKNLEKKVTFRLSNADLKLLGSIAEKDGLKVSFVVRRLVQNFIYHKQRFKDYRVD